MAKGRDSTRVVDLFTEALERPVSERDEFITMACGADRELRVRVTRLLSGARPGFMEQPALELERRGAEEAAGQRVGAYELVRPLASGGMGSVWLARRADESFQAVAALKLIKRGMDTDDILARFRAERQVLANLRHPNIAALLDGGATDDGRPYLVMEYVDGEPIDRYCRARGLSIRRRVELFRSVCAAVEHAHRATVVHRDIKPANILVTTDGTPKLLDFGIAKVVTQNEKGEATATRHRILTPGYASPEQVRGEPITTATDVYSLGVVLYELLTCRRPYDVATDSPAALERAICETEPPRPSTAVVRGPAPEDDRRAAQRQLAGDLDTIVLTALRKEPERRYGSVTQLSEDLRRYLEGLPVSARPDTVRYRAGKFVRRNKVLVGSGFLVLASLIAGLAVSTVLYLHARRAKDAETVQRDIAQGEAREAERQRGLAEWRAYSAQIGAALGALRAGDVVGARSSLNQTLPELRGWEYRYALGQLDASTDRFVAHGAWLYGLAVSPDQTTLATSADDGTVRLWDRPTHALRTSLPFFNSSVGNIAFSPDGTLLAIPTGARQLMLWDLAMEREFQRLGGHSTQVRAVAFSPDGLRLVTGSTDGTAILWTRPTPRDPFARAATLGASHTGDIEADRVNQVRGVAFSPDGNTVATVNFDGIARLWDGRTGTHRADLAGHQAGIYTAAFSPDGRQLVTTSLDRTLRLWSVEGAGTAKVLRGHTERVVNAVFSPDGRVIASASWDRSIRLWDAQSGEPIATLLGHENNVFGLAFTADSRTLYSDGIDGTVRSWAIPESWEAPEVGDTRRALSVLVGPGWRAVGLSVSASRLSPGVYAWDSDHNRPGAPLLLAADELTAAASGGDVIAAAMPDGIIALTRIPSDAAPRRLSADRQRIRALAVSPDGQRLLCGADDGHIRLWDAASSAQLADWTDSVGPVRAITFTPDGEGLAAVYERGSCITRPFSGGALRRVNLPGEGSALAFSPDGRTLAVASGIQQQQIALLAWPSLERLATLRGHTNTVQGLAFSPDTNRLASVSMDHTVRIWDPQRAMEAATLYGHEYGVFSVAWDGDALLTGAADGRIRVWKPAGP